MKKDKGLKTEITEMWKMRTLQVVPIILGLLGIWASKSLLIVPIK